MGVFSFATLTALLVIGLIFNGINAKRVRSEYTQVDKSSKIIGHYIHLLKLIENENFQSQKLSSLKLNLSKNNFSASGEIKAILFNFNIRQLLFDAIFGAYKSPFPIWNS